MLNSRRKAIRGVGVKCQKTQRLGILFFLEIPVLFFCCINGFCVVVFCCCFLPFSSTPYVVASFSGLRASGRKAGS